MTSLRLNAELKITAGQRTISGQNCNLPGQKLQSPLDMLTGHACTLVHEKNSQILTRKSYILFLRKKHNCVHKVKITKG